MAYLGGGANILLSKGRVNSCLDPDWNQNERPTKTNLAHVFWGDTCVKKKRYNKSMNVKKRLDKRLESSKRRWYDISLSFHLFTIKTIQFYRFRNNNYTMFAVRNEPKPVLTYRSIRNRLSTYLNANYGHLKIRFFQKDKRIFENNGSFLAANWVGIQVNNGRSRGASLSIPPTATTCNTRNRHWPKGSPYTGHQKRKKKTLHQNKQGNRIIKGTDSRIVTILKVPTPKVP